MKKENPMHLLLKTKGRKEEGDHLKGPPHILGTPIEDSKGIIKILVLQLPRAWALCPRIPRKEECSKVPTVASTTTSSMIEEKAMIEEEVMIEEGEMIEGEMLRIS